MYRNPFIRCYIEEPFSKTIQRGTCLASLVQSLIEELGQRDGGEESSKNEQKDEHNGICRKYVAFLFFLF